MPGLCVSWYPAPNLHALTTVSDEWSVNSNSAPAYDTLPSRKHAHDCWCETKSPIFNFVVYCFNMIKRGPPRGVEKHVRHHYGTWCHMFYKRKAESRKLVNWCMNLMLYPSTTKNKEKSTKDIIWVINLWSLNWIEFTTISMISVAVSWKVSITHLEHSDVAVHHKLFIINMWVKYASGMDLHVNELYIANALHIIMPNKFSDMKNLPGWFQSNFACSRDFDGWLMKTEVKYKWNTVNWGKIM